MYLVIRFDILPGKMAECDKYIENELIPFFTSQKEVHRVGVLEDKFIGWPERELYVEVDDLTSLQNIMASKETRQMKEHFTSYAIDIQTQIMDLAFSKP